MNFNESNVFRSTPNMIKLLIHPDLPNAKEYLKRVIPPSYLPLLNRFGAYTLEAIMTHVPGLVFHSVRDYSVVTLLDQLNGFVRDQSRFLSVQLPHKVRC